jgi:hypothetical protein
VLLDINERHPASDLQWAVGRRLQAENVPPLQIERCLRLGVALFSAESVIAMNLRLSEYQAAVTSVNNAAMNNGATDIPEDILAASPHLEAMLYQSRQLSMLLLRETDYSITRLLTLDALAVNATKLRISMTKHVNMKEQIYQYASTIATRRNVKTKMIDESVIKLILAHDRDQKAKGPAFESIFTSVSNDLKLATNLNAIRGTLSYGAWCPLLCSRGSLSM